MNSRTIHALVVVGAFASAAAPLAPAFVDAVGILAQDLDTAQDSILKQGGAGTLAPPDITLDIASGIEFAHATTE